MDKWGEERKAGVNTTRTAMQSILDLTGIEQYNPSVGDYKKFVAALHSLQTHETPQEAPENSLHLPPRAIPTQMAEKTDEIAILKMVFAGMKEKYYTFDINGDGTITNEEFRQVLEDMVGEPCPEEDWKEFIGKVDYDCSGTISFEEFLYALYLWFADDEVLMIGEHDLIS